MVVAAWLFGPLYNVARIIPTSGITADGICIHHLIWPNRFWNSFTSVISCCLYFFVPLILIVSLYISIFLNLRKRINKGPLSESNDKVSAIMNKATTNVLKTSIFVTACFFLCWIWNVCWFFLFSIGVPLVANTPFYNFTSFMRNINCCVNPFCYAVQYREFQEQVKILFCKHSTRKPEENTSRYTSSTSAATI